MNKSNEYTKQSGKFKIYTEQCSDREIYGELTIAGENSLLYLRDNEYFNTFVINNPYITGILNDLKKVTLINCIPKVYNGTRSFYNERYHFAEIFPHFILTGNFHLNPLEKKISEVSFIINDATSLFYDFDVFSCLIDAKPHIKQIVDANTKIHGRNIPIGPDPVIFYYSGKTNIFLAKTIIGEISAFHAPSYNLGGPSGVSLDNNIYLKIKFKEYCTFDEAINHTMTILRFMGIIIGRPQTLQSFNLSIESDDANPKILNIYQCMPLKYNRRKDERNSSPGEVLIEASSKPDEFSTVLCNWLENNNSWNDARLRFYNSFSETTYSIDRLIGSSNMFDILPETAFPPDVSLPDNILNAKDECLKIFKELPNSPERDSILNALGRIGKPSLKNKIRHRNKIIIDNLGDTFSDLNLITDEAVNCRNYYVHGSKSKIDYSNEKGIEVFLTNTLEFVFAISDLIETGWDPTDWKSSGSSGSHPYGNYLVSYNESIKWFKSIISKYYKD